MKHSLASVKTLWFGCLLFVLSCNNDHHTVSPIASQGTVADQGKENLKTLVPVSFDLTVCNLLVKLFNPPSTAWYTISTRFYDSNYRTFGVQRSNVPDYNKVDIIKFEYSGKNYGKGGVAKLYRIRRSDGLYLTQYDGARLSYKTISTSTTTEATQLWILHDLGNRKYKLILPTLATGCEVARVNHDGDAYRFTTRPSNQTYPEITFGLEPTLKIPANPN